MGVPGIIGVTRPILLPHPRVARILGTPIIAHGGGGWKDWQVEEPIVIGKPGDPTKLVMFMSGVAPNVTTCSIARYEADVSNPTVWTFDRILLDGAVTNRRLDSVVEGADGTLHMFASNMDSNCVDHLDSTDGGLTFTFRANVLTPAGQGRVDGDVVQQAAVLREGTTLHMFYNYRNGGDVLPGIRYASATTANWDLWTKGGSGDLISRDGAWATKYFEWQQVLKRGSKYLLVPGVYNGRQWNTVMYSATDPLGPWSQNGFPIYQGSGIANEWDEFHISTVAWYQIGSTWYLFGQAAPWTDADGGHSYLRCHWDMFQAQLEVGAAPEDFCVP